MTAETIDRTGLFHGPEGVVLIHGLARSTGSMWLLAQRLEAEGFVTTRIGYPSTRLPVEGSVDHVDAAIRRAVKGWGRINLVGHSLGGVIARLIAERAHDLPIGRVVQLGAPNSGSELAETVSRLPAARAVFGPALDEIARLAPSAARVQNVGAIAGTLPVDALGEIGGLSGPNDGFVSVASAWDGAEARIAIPSVHGWMPLSPAVSRQVARFLRDGRFEERS